MTAAELQQRLSQKYDRALWLDTLRHILPQTVLFKSPQTVPIENPRAKSILQLGKIPLAGDRNLAVLALLVDETTDLPGNRAALRHLVAKYIDQAEYHGVFAIFHQPSSDDYRFTFVAREAALDDSGQVVRTETAPRRYTYLLGPNQSCRTAAERLDLLARKGINASIADVRAAFDKEPLTREFFKRFENAIEAVKEDLEKFQSLPSAQAYSRAQLLLERLLFLYFVQNRGWLDQKRNYLLDNFATHKVIPDQFTYYADFLEPVFFTLSTPPDFKGPGAGIRLPGLPFLNGGLFDDDEFAQTADRKRDNPPLRVRNATFENVFENLLEAFNFTAHEDTPIDQDVAVDPEMLGKVFESIVLHAEAADPDAVAPDKRKATGSYYTPRIVVHFICRESLCQYLLPRLQEDSLLSTGEKRRGKGANPQADSLASTGGEGRGEGAKSDWNRRLRALLDILALDGLDTDELARLKTLLTPAEGRQILDLIRNLKCLDPSVGSGAFPVGLLHELVNLRRICEAAALGYVDPIRKHGNQWVHEQKAEIVENCLYGVDLQQQAIEICRLRLWLSLVVDYDLGCDPFSADARTFRTAIRDISQLPNLEMNFRRGDSLLDMISGVPIRVTSDLLTGRSDEVAEIQKLGHQLHKARSAEKKKKLRLEILHRRLDLSQGVLTEEERLLRTNQQVGGLFGDENDSDAEKRRRAAAEIEKLDLALAEIATDRKELEKLIAKPLASDFYPRLRKLEGADFDSPFNFVWRIDYAEIFAPRKSKTTITGDFNLGDELAPQARQAGFDLIVGNPPFVTARNPTKRQLYRTRWPRVCEGNYLLISPFFELSFGLLRPNGQLGFIVSNAFARRDIGKPLVQNFFPTVNLQKVIDCSGLLFPGHGTPTCILFGSQEKPKENTPIRVAALLPGGGDLRTPPEDSPVWHSLAMKHDTPGFANKQVLVADQRRSDLSRHPWNFDCDGESTKRLLEANCAAQLKDYTDDNIGRDSSSQADDIYYMPLHCFRRMKVEAEFLRPLVVGEQVRDWQINKSEYTLWPYRGNAVPELSKNVEDVLEPFRSLLESRSLFSKTTLEAGLRWFEYREYYVRGLRDQIVFPYIATHGHFSVSNEPSVFNRHALLFTPAGTFEAAKVSLFIGLFNSSTSVFWLKQYCFNKGAGADEERDRFEFAGGRVEEMPIPVALAQWLSDKSHAEPNALIASSLRCWQRGQQLPALALAKLFEKPDEAYAAWTTSLPGYVPPAKEFAPPFTTEQDCRSRLQSAIARREQLRSDMIALQEEMDWLVYQAYGVLPDNSPAISTDTDPAPLQESERPFRLWSATNGDFNAATRLIPSHWLHPRRALWEARLAAIRDNEHIRRIEAPVYKRRWDEQWKVSNRWMAGPIAYAQELVDAFRHWLAEKAEWHLEHKAKSGPLSLEAWTTALASDPRVQAAWPVVAEAIHQIEVWKVESNGKKSKKVSQLDASTAAFAKFFRDTVNEETVSDGIPTAVPWEELEKKMSVPKHAKNVRGKLNVPRERFRLRDTGYMWAGTQ